MAKEARRFKHYLRLRLLLHRHPRRQPMTAASRAMQIRSWNRRRQHQLLLRTLELVQQQQLQPPAPQRIPSLHDICGAHWPTLANVPPDIRDDWSSIFVDTVHMVLHWHSEETLAILFLTSKALLASVRHGGKARMEAANRTLRARITLWRAGRYWEL